MKVRYETIKHKTTLKIFLSEIQAVLTMANIMPKRVLGYWTPTE